MRAQFFGPERVDHPDHRAARGRAIRASSAPSTSTSATPTASIASSREHAAVARAHRPHRRAAVARLGRLGAARRTSPSTPTARSTCSRPRAATSPTRRSSSPRRTRSTATGPTSCRSWSSTTRLELPEDHEYFGGIARDDVDRPHPALALRRVEGGRRRARAGVRPLLRDADGLLPRRLPDRSGARGAKLHGFLAYLMRCTVTGEPYTIFGYGGKQVRDNIHAADVVRAFEAFHAGPAQRGGLQPRRRPRQRDLDARGDRGLRAHRRPRARVHPVRRRPHGRPPLVDLRPRRLPGRLSRLGHHVRPRAHAVARSTTRTWSSGRAA